MEMLQGIGAAGMFYLLGIQGLYKNMRSPLILRRVLLSMILVVGLICAPLGYQRADRIREGQLRPRSYPLSPVLSEMIRERIDQVPGVNLLLAGRAGVDYETTDIAIVLCASRPDPLAFCLFDKWNLSRHFVIYYCLNLVLQLNVGHRFFP